jgi:hypothetical protein
MTDADACVYRRVLYGRGGRGAGRVGGSLALQCSKVGKWQAMQRRRVCLIHGWMAG